MSTAIFDTISVVKNDRSILGVTQLPSVAELRQCALTAPYVLRYEASDIELSGAYDETQKPGAAVVSSSVHACPKETVAVSGAFGPLSPAVISAVRATLDHQWPSTLQEWPLCDVGGLWLAHPAVRRPTSSATTAGNTSTSSTNSATAILGHGELLCASRWEVVGTVFSLERYQLVRVPLRTESAWRHWQTVTAPTVDTPELATGGMHRLHNHPGGSPSATIVWGDGLWETLTPASATTAPTTSTSAASQRYSAGTQRPSLPLAGRSPLESVEQAAGAVVECTVCRIVSNLEGEPPVPHVAAQRLLGLTDAALRECFFGTCVPLLGVTQDERGRRWQKVQRAQELNRSFSPCSAMEADNSGLHEGGMSGTHTTTTTTAIGRASPAQRYASFSTEASDLNVHWGGVPVAYTASRPASAQTPVQDRHVHRHQDERASLPTPSTSQRGSTLSSSLHTPTTQEELWQRYALGRSNHVAWQLLAMPSLFEMNYFNRAGEGWRRWRDLCGGGINRHLIVNSIDEIVDYCACSRRAFYAAVACLDRFVAMATDPTENCRAYLRAIGAPHTTPITMDRIVTFFTQVITVCAMLGCKNMDLYPPHVNKVLLCLKPSMRLTLSDFDALELHILATIQFNIQPATLDSIVETLLYACGTDAFQEDTVNVRHYYALFDTTRAGEQYLKDDFEQRMRKASASVQSRRARQEELRAAVCRGQPMCEAGPDSASHTDLAPPPTDVWDDFCQFARFLCDQLIRGGKHRNASPNPEGSAAAGATGPGAEVEAWATEGYLWALPPVLLATAVVVVTAEMLNVPLPTPLLCLLPAAYKDGLRDKQLSLTSSIGTASLATVTQPHVDDDDARTVLKYYVVLLQQAASTLASEANLPRERGHSGAQAVMSSAIGVVQYVYQQCRSTPCDKPLLKRYQTLFKRLNPVS